MSLLDRIAAWLDVRPGEAWKVVLSFLGAFFVISFLILGRSLREAIYLATFPVETLPYITAAVAFLSVPTVAAFARLVSRRNPQTVLKVLMIVLAGGVAVLWRSATREPGAVVAFYLWIALGSLLLTSGFWLVTAELFPIRGAKRLFGLIGAGGTLGAMVTGNAVALLSEEVRVGTLIPGLIAILVLFFAVEALRPDLPGAATGPRRADEDTSSVWAGLGAAARRPHLRIVALIVLTATVASTLVDYQFKELARANLDTSESLAGFFGAFYGWTGAISLLVQLLVVGRLMASAGVAVALAVLPAILLLGSAGLLLVPALAVATIVRGADNSLRKSLHRSALEVLWVPIPARVRRKTKTFIDSVVDAIGEGAGAAIVFLWVTLPGLPSRYLSAFVILLATLFVHLSRRMGNVYVATVTEQLREGRRDAAAETDRRDLLSVSFTRVDIRPLLEESGVATATTELSASAARAADAVEEPRRRAAGADSGRGGEEVAEAREDRGPESLLARLDSPFLEEVRAALDASPEWGEAHIPALTRLLARDALYDRVVSVLRRLEDLARPHLLRALRDPATDFAIRRRIPRVLATYRAAEADAALLEALTAPRFEVRYRAAIALVRRRREAAKEADHDWRRDVWAAVRAEVSRERPVWELQRLLDDFERPDDTLVARRVGARGELSLEHTFRLLSLVQEPDAVRSAFHGLTAGNERLRSLALEYLDQTLPDDVREKLWPFIGDLSDYQRRRSERPLQEVVSDLVTTGATLFASETERGALRRLLDDERRREAGMSKEDQGDG